MTSRPPEIRASLDNELIIDNFAGGGGASLGTEHCDFVCPFRDAQVED